MRHRTIQLSCTDQLWYSLVKARALSIQTPVPDCQERDVDYPLFPDLPLRLSQGQLASEAGGLSLIVTIALILFLREVI